MPIDTHQTYRRLLEAGMPEPQADAQARIFGEWTEERLVTREYLDLRLENFGVQVDKKLAEQEQRIVAKLTARIPTAIGFATAILGSIIGLLIYIVRSAA